MYGTETHRNLWPRWVVVPHPLAALAPEAVMRRADAVVERIIEQLITTH
jgi:hypothetical protein